ncbi:unnamed protein product [Adineta steineri]|uniref:Nuclear receptor domain-containing protein n=1 Tax=Adineta steineri TaxID=433720 RepID=A0A814GTK2_9BILA|nr:unnamed protein product [Adineta steineri]CAF1303162.1 unnamed protein product [Adineta steineri]CAF1304215.1 unnamed protein product [Adineta steineri]
MQYDFVDELTEIASFDGLETKENMHLYQTHQPQDSFLKSTISNSNMITTSDIWQTSSSNSNTINQSFYFPSSFDFNNTSNPNQYHTMDNNNYDYNSLPDVSSSSASASTYLMDPYSHMFTNNYPVDPYSTQTSYNSTSMDYTSSTYLSTTDSYQHLHPMYTNTNGMTIPPASSYISSPSSSCIDIQPDYQSTMSQWDSTMIKMRTHDVTSASNSSNSSTSASKQPCLVCHEESSGYHFGAYTCESCKAFYRRVTKDPRIEIKHSCEVPLPNITKLNRKDCRACRKAKCDRVGMTAMPKDRAPRTTTTKTTTYKTPTIPITDLLEQLARDLTYDQLSTSSALESLLRIIDLPPILPININYHTIYMNAVRIWRNQYSHPLQIIADASLMDTFPVLLFLFQIFITMTENDEDKSTNNSKFNKLVNILQQEIHRITGTDHRSASRIKALFMKCYVALAQYPNSTNLLDDNNSISQSQFLSYQPYPVYGQ